LEATMPTNSLVIFFLMALFFTAMLQVHFFEIAFVKLGLTPEAVSILLLGTLLGSTINLPVYSIQSKESGRLIMSPGRKMIWEIFQQARMGRVVITVNVGGCLIPVLALIFKIIKLWPHKQRCGTTNCLQHQK
jgi:uncharacterized membrane protein